MFSEVPDALIQFNVDIPMLVKEKVQKHKVNETIYQLYHVHYKSYLSFALPDPEALPVCAGASCFLGTGTEERGVILFRHCTKREKVENFPGGRICSFHTDGGAASGKQGRSEHVD